MKKKKQQQNNKKINFNPLLKKLLFHILASVVIQRKGN